MEIEYELTIEDIAAFARFHVKHGPKLKPAAVARRLATALLAMIAVLMALAGWLSWQGQSSWAAGCCAGFIGGALMIIFLLALLNKKLVIENTLRVYDREECRWYFSWRHLRITADGFEISNEFEQLRYRWSVVFLIESTDEHIFFYTTLHQAHIVPRRAFRNAQHFEEFADLACRYHKGLVPFEAASDVILDALPVEQTGITRPRHS